MKVSKEVVYAAINEALGVGLISTVDTPEHVRDNYNKIEKVVLAAFNKQQEIDDKKGKL